jgi:hypothetical protein
MAEIESVVRDLCDAGAAAIHRYIQVSGEDPSDMPEHFMPAFILDHVGSKITMTLETGFSKLSKWNQNTRQGRGLPPRGQEEVTELLALALELGLPRVDMVLYEGNDDGRPKDQLGLLALVEFKKGPSTVDRNKLLRILPHVDTCPYGIVCGSRGIDRDWDVEDARKMDDRWFETAVQPSPGDKKPYFFSARLFSRSASLSS